MRLKIGGILFLFIFFVACKDYTPKPMGYNRIEISEHGSTEYSFPFFSFQYKGNIRIDTLRAVNDNEIWFNIVYPEFKAVVYCTYLPVTKLSLPKALEDSYHLAYSHVTKADKISQELYSNPENKVSGILYKIEGDVATPVQFLLTDSLTNFLRGSFYYTFNANADSVAPITEYVTKDIEAMMTSLRWKSKTEK